MTPIDTRLRTLLAEAKAQGRSLHSITVEAEVGYFKVYGWLRGRSPSLDVTVAEKIHIVLTGRAFQ